MKQRDLDTSPDHQQPANDQWTIPSSRPAGDDYVDQEFGVVSSGLCKNHS